MFPLCESIYFSAYLQKLNFDRFFLAQQLLDFMQTHGFVSKIIKFELNNARFEGLFQKTLRQNVSTIAPL